MIIVGCDYHPGFQQIAFVDTDSGELQERRLQHREEAEEFYRELAAQGMKVRVGMEDGATSTMQFQNQNPGAFYRPYRFPNLQNRSCSFFSNRTTPAKLDIQFSSRRIVSSNASERFANNRITSGLPTRTEPLARRPLPRGVQRIHGAAVRLGLEPLCELSTPPMFNTSRINAPQDRSGRAVRSP